MQRLVIAARRGRRILVCPFIAVVWSQCYLTADSDCRARRRRCPSAIVPVRSWCCAGRRALLADRPCAESFSTATALTGAISHEYLCALVLEPNLHDAHAESRLARECLTHLATRFAAQLERRLERPALARRENCTRSFQRLAVLGAERFARVGVVDARLDGVHGVAQIELVVLLADELALDDQVLGKSALCNFPGSPDHPSGTSARSRRTRSTARGTPGWHTCTRGRPIAADCSTGRICAGRYCKQGK